MSSDDKVRRSSSLKKFLSPLARLLEPVYTVPDAQRIAARAFAQKNAYIEILFGQLNRWNGREAAGKPVALSGQFLSETAGASGC
ncbi:MAG: hypothetical protein K2X57_04615 [Xanthobacteraceae bacterium]|nr:hypothetical protein [Xanthobacteraceae bacterium]MBY0611669.1 hypothetical protein [Beijerinckiaceae bacterium]